MNYPFVLFLFLKDKINNSNQITPENDSAATEIQRSNVMNVAPIINNPMVVSPAVYKLSTVLPRHTSINCGNITKPNSRLTVAITKSCHILLHENRDYK